MNVERRKNNFRRKLSPHAHLLSQMNSKDKKQQNEKKGLKTGKQEKDENEKTGKISLSRNTAGAIKKSEGV